MAKEWFSYQLIARLIPTSVGCDKSNSWILPISWTWEIEVMREEISVSSGEKWGKIICIGKQKYVWFNIKNKIKNH